VPDYSGIYKYFESYFLKLDKRVKTRLKSAAKIKLARLMRPDQQNLPTSVLLPDLQMAS